jgi:glycosyltransferase involved in cell wall biosynthesis
VSFHSTKAADGFGKLRRAPQERKIAEEDLTKSSGYLGGGSNFLSHERFASSVQPVKVSVLIPVFNGAHYLGECLDSILAQNFSDMEILILDDGSTDQSLDIIKKFAARDARIYWWKNSHHRGLTANSNACLNAARGDYVKFVHQDDKLLSSEAIGKMVAMLDQNPGAILAGSRQHLTGTDSLPTVFSKKSGCFNGRQMIVRCLEQHTNLIGQPTLTLFRRLQAQRGFDERYTGMMDYEMWFYLLEQGDFAYLAEPLATWRVHEHQQTARAEGTSDGEFLQFVKDYYAKPWLVQLATKLMLFRLVYTLRKKYGNDALPLITIISKQLLRRGYRWELLKYKVSSPFKKLFRKLQRSL